jgi:general secretion pathway protein G
MNKGFTLIEMLVVMVILGVLFGLAVPQLAGRTQEARVQGALADLHGGLAVALDMYEVDLGRYPTSLTDLAENPSNLTKWKGPYLKRKHARDPWGNSYIYRYPGQWNRGSYDLWSAGPDGKEGSEDDLTNQEEAS